MARSPPPRARLFLSASLLIFFFPCLCHGLQQEEQVAGMFVFGSSHFDNGNNVFLRVSAKANYRPYGIDFPVGTTGRFSNGKTMADWLGEFLKLPAYVPAFADPKATGEKILGGVNFAAASSGILDATGHMRGMTSISLSEQITNFETVTLPALKESFGEELPERLSKYLFLVGSGGNDYLLNYLFNHNHITLKNFTLGMLSTFSGQLKRLYGLGARKFVLLSVEPMGCLPLVRSSPLGGGSCVEIFNRVAQFFGTHLQSLVTDIKPQLPEANLVHVNIYKIIKDIIDDPISHGFNETSKACCELPSNRRGGSGMLCARNGKPCSDRAAHVFWDGVHPTQAVSHLMAKKAYQSDCEEEVFPMNVRQLASL